MPEIEYFYATHSAFAYIGASRLYEVAKANNAQVIHRPIDLALVMEAVGASGFRERTVPHRQYFFGREIERWSEYRNAPLIAKRPTWHDEPLALSNGLVIAAIEAGHNVDELSLAILKAHWLEDANHNDPGILSALAKSVSIEPEPLLDQAMSNNIQAIHKANTEEAIARSVFGSPTYFVDGDMFYGQDRLELVGHALQKPFSGTWPK